MRKRNPWPLSSRLDAFLSIGHFPILPTRWPSHCFRWSPVYEGRAPRWGDLARPGRSAEMDDPGLAGLGIGQLVRLPTLCLGRSSFPRVSCGGITPLFSVGYRRIGLFRGRPRIVVAGTKGESPPKNSLCFAGREFDLGHFFRRKPGIGHRAWLPTLL